VHGRTVNEAKDAVVVHGRTVNEAKDAIKPKEIKLPAPEPILNAGYGCRVYC